MMDIIHAFKEKDTRDELGIGTIRDGLADLLFPGTGTVQTRARYFLFIAWTYQYLERRNFPSSEITTTARSIEVEMITALEKGGERSGIIGIEARQNLKRLPSNIYWLGLGLWGIRLFSGTQDHYHRSLDGWYKRRQEQTTPDKNENYSDGTWSPNWHPGIPPPPEKWRWEIDFALTRDEARFLRDCIMNRTAGSLLAFLASQREPLAECDFCWESEVIKDAPAENRRQIEHSRNFSDIMHGASILYNLLLAEKAKNDDLRDEYREQMAAWSDLIEERRGALSAWDRQEFRLILEENEIRVSLRTQDFVNQWIDGTLSASSPSDLADNKMARTLIRQREQTLKKGLARLENPRALELWNGAAGLGRLDYRWQIARQMVNDIMEGLGRA